MNTVHTFNLFNTIVALLEESRDYEGFEKAFHISKVESHSKAWIQVVNQSKPVFMITYNGDENEKYKIEYRLGNREQTFSTNSTTSILKFVMAMLHLDNLVWA